jgi:transcriptional regulator with XRE-family HTH domain
MSLEDLFSNARLRCLPEPWERREIREDAGITQLELAEVLGVSRAALSRWESGNREPSRRFATEYAAVLREIVNRPLS